ncbi:MAG TPA: hypothetical protein VG347_04195 [Verrucomicrobiae bacterium]|nr:hypothetical protein [Verrucomicrobiae bacterium]
MKVIKCTGWGAGAATMGGMLICVMRATPKKDFTFRAIHVTALRNNEAVAIIGNYNSGRKVKLKGVSA